MKYPVSIIIPVYGVEKYIERCAISLFEQTMENIEYIFVDDCSPDNSINILRTVLSRYENRTPHTKIVRMPKNSGQAAVRRYGLSLATGEYVIHCDSDDWVELNMYETLYATAVKGNYDIVICDYYNSQDNGIDTHITQLVSDDKNEFIRGILNESIHASLCNKLVRRSIYNNDIIYPKDNLREDLTLMVQFAYYANSIKHINAPYYHYYCNVNSITGNDINISKRISLIEQSIRNFGLLEVFLKKMLLTNSFSSEIFNMKCRLKAYAFTLLLEKGGYKEWNSLFPEINIKNLLLSNLHISSKIGYVIAKLRLYPTYWFIKNRLRR